MCQKLSPQISGSVTIFVNIERPFAINDWITVDDKTGYVENITWRSTRIRTFQNTEVIIPNEIVADSILTNWSKQDKVKMSEGFHIFNKLNLINYFINTFNIKNNSQLSIDELSLNFLKTYHWPGNIQELKQRYQDNLWIIYYTGNQMSFSNAIWGGLEIVNHSFINETTNKAEIKLLNDFSINQFIKGIVDHVEIIEIKKKSPSIQDVFINKKEITIFKNKKINTKLRYN